MNHLLDVELRYVDANRDGRIGVVRIGRHGRHQRLARSDGRHGWFDATIFLHHRHHHRRRFGLGITFCGRPFRRRQVGSANASMISTPSPSLSSSSLDGAGSFQIHFTAIKSRQKSSTGNQFQFHKKKLFDLRKYLNKKNIVGSVNQSFKCVSV